MFDCPIDYFENNLIFNRDKSCWAVFSLKGFDYDLLSDETKITLLNRITLFLSDVASEAKILIVPIMQDLQEHFNGLRENIQKTDLLYEYATSQANDTEQYLKQTIEINGRVNDYKTYVIVKLVKDDEYDVVAHLKDAFSFIVKSVTNDINAFMDIDTKDILKSKIENFKKLSENFYNQQNQRISLEPVTAKTLQWLLRRMVYRGLAKDVKLFHKSMSEDWQPSAQNIKLAGESYVRPNKKDIVNLFSGVITKDNRFIKIEHEKEEISYQTFLVITNIPEELEFPNCEWLYMLQKYNSQAEICIHIQNIEHRQSLKNLELKKRAISSQIEHIEHASSEIPDDLLISKEQADYLESELKSARYPMTKTAVTICVSADNVQDMEKRAAKIKRDYEDMNFIVERPLTDQFNLFVQFIPSTSFCVSDFIMNLTPMALASGIIGATHELGDYIGPYIGTTGRAKKHVFLDMRLACLTNRSASATFYGNLGVGKSFNANLLIYLHVLYGGYGLIFDPKGERTHWVEDLDVLKGLINLVTLSPDPKYKGMLDPFNIYRGDENGLNEACELTINLISELFKLKPRDLEYTALLAGIKQIKSEKTPSMLRLSEILDNFEPEDNLYKNAKLLARQLNLLQDAGMSQLLFGDGTEESIKINNRLNILQIQNLKLPSPTTKKDDYTQEENLSTVLMMVMSSFAKKFIQSLPGKFKISLFDESWMLGQTAAGVALMEYYGRMGRSLYCSMILNGHSVQDLPNDGIKNTITYKFCFKTTNTDEAIRMLKYLSLEETQSNIELIKDLGNAECLFQDLNGRVGILKFDAVFQDIIDVFSTTPVDAKDEKTEENAEEKDLLPENEVVESDIEDGFIIDNESIMYTPRSYTLEDIFAYETK